MADTGARAKVNDALRAAHAEAVAKQRGVAQWKLAGDRDWTEGK
eukprot:SAG31_NODE_154_length_22184_cov_25.917142_12_plen_44_part_00